MPSGAAPWRRRQILTPRRIAVAANASLVRRGNVGSESQDNTVRQNARKRATPSPLLLFVHQLFIPPPPAPTSAKLVCIAEPSAVEGGGIGNDCGRQKAPTPPAARSLFPPNTRPRFRGTVAVHPPFLSHFSPRTCRRGLLTLEKVQTRCGGGCVTGTTGSAMPWPHRSTVCRASKPKCWLTDLCSPSR